MTIRFPYQSIFNLGFLQKTINSPAADPRQAPNGLILTLENIMNNPSINVTKGQSIILELPKVGTWELTKVSRSLGQPKIIDTQDEENKKLFVWATDLPYLRGHTDHQIEFKWLKPSEKPQNIQFTFSINE